MNNDALSHGLWEASSLPPPSTYPLSENIAVDVAIVGAGFTGLSTALHLAEGGASVAVLEAVEIGFGASGRNAGLVNAGAWIYPDELAARLGDVYGPRLLRLLGDGPSLLFDLIDKHGIVCEAVKNGNLHCAVGAKGLAEITERARQWHAHGVPVRILGAEGTASMVGSHAYTGALLDPRTGTVQPLAYARGLGRAALAAGTKIFTQTPIVGAQANSTGWQLEAAKGHKVSARTVVVATNTAHGVIQDTWPQLQSEMVRLPYFNLATEPLSASVAAQILPERHGAWDTASVISSFRMDAAGRLIYGSVGALRGLGHSVHVNWARRAVEKLFPQLCGIGFQYHWYGWIDTTANALPFLHQLAPNTWAFSGYNGRGIAPGTTLGREMARMILGQVRVEDMPLLVSEIKPIGLKRPKEVFYEIGAQVAHAAFARF